MNIAILLNSLSALDVVGLFTMRSVRGIFVMHGVRSWMKLDSSATCCALIVFFTRMLTVEASYRSAVGYLNNFSQ